MSSPGSSQKAELGTKAFVQEAYFGEWSQQTGVKTGGSEAKKEGEKVAMWSISSPVRTLLRSCVEGTLEFSAWGKKKESIIPWTSILFWKVVLWGIDSLTTSTLYRHVQETRRQSLRSPRLKERHMVKLKQGMVWVHLPAMAGIKGGPGGERHAQMSNTVYYEKKRLGVKDIFYLLHIHCKFHVGIIFNIQHILKFNWMWGLTQNFWSVHLKPINFTRCPHGLFLENSTTFFFFF